MAKKKRSRPNISAQTLERARAELDMGDEAVVESKASATKPEVKPKQQVVKSVKRTISREELSAEYGYVLGDLQSMALLAALLFVLMVVVSLGIESLV